MKQLTLKRLSGRYAIARLAPQAAIPDWADGGGFASVTRTDEELSVLCEEARVPDAVPADCGWRGYRFAGTFDFDATGIAAAALGPLAAADVPVLLISSFDTDYLFVKDPDAARAEVALRGGGHAIE